MLFNSVEYLFVFFPVVFVVYFYLNRRRMLLAAHIFLGAASLFFYGWWNPDHIWLIIVSLLTNYVLGSLISGQQNDSLISRKSILVLGVVFNVSLLLYYKYADFIVANINLLPSVEVEPLGVELPLAVSFFTFQQIAYLSDVYLRKVKESNPLDYSLFVLFFPQLIAGPIVHHREIIPQFGRLRNKVVSYRNVSLGLFVFSIGLFKKVGLADSLYLLAGEGLTATEPLSFLEAWATSLAQSMRLYFDFSGYTDMAIGSALLFNIRLPINFYSPYKACSLIEFWSRWHITLSKFTETYIFRPLIKSVEKYSFTNAMMALFLSMLIIGIWHGAGWMFLLFGALHGVGAVVNHIWKKRVRIAIGNVLGWFLTFNVVNVSIVLLSVENMGSASNILEGMVGMNGFVLPEVLKDGLSFLPGAFVEFGDPLSFVEKDWELLALLVGSFVIALGTRNSIQMIEARVLTGWSAAFAASLFVYSVMSINELSEFIYFHF